MTKTACQLVKFSKEDGDKAMVKRQVTLTEEQYNVILTALKIEIFNGKNNPTHALELLEDAQKAMLENCKLIRE